jgi:hypothetical protein
MTKIRRGGYVLVSWIGDHSPSPCVPGRRTGAEVGSGELADMKGAASRQLLELIRDLLEEGLL